VNIDWRGIGRPLVGSDPLKKLRLPDRAAWPQNLGPMPEHRTQHNIHYRLLRATTKFFLWLGASCGGALSSSRLLYCPLSLAALFHFNVRIKQVAEALSHRDVTLPREILR